MTINFLPQKGFPFGNNVHFVYNITSKQFIFLHTSFDWILSSTDPEDTQKVLSKIEEEDASFLEAIFNKVLAGNFTGKITFKLRHADGLQWLQAIPFLSELDGEKVISGTLIDVTSEMRNTESIKKFADKKNSILQMLGHDLRGPLNVAKSVMQVVERDISDPIILQKTGYIAGILQQSIDTISDLIKREFLETTNTDLVKKRVNIVKKLRDYIEECKRSEAVSGIRFHLQSSSNKIFIKLDHAKFMQVVNNLISNSMKFTPSGGTISISIEERPDDILFKFTDDGIGIPAQLLPEIFDRFTTARRPGLQGEPTYGLGLSIVKTLIDWHQGTISCESTEGSGTTFFIELPKNLPS